MFVTLSEITPDWRTSSWPSTDYLGIWSRNAFNNPLGVIRGEALIGNYGDPTLCSCASIRTWHSVDV